MAKTYFEKIPVRVVKNIVAAVPACKDIAHSSNGCRTMGKSAQRQVRAAESAIKTGREGNRSHPMTSDKRERMLSLCALIAKEPDPHKFSELLQELNDFLLEETTSTLDAPMKTP